MWVQAELKEATALLLQKAVPGLTDDLVARMKVSPLRQFDPQLIQEPLVYRLYEVTPILLLRLISLADPSCSLQSITRCICMSQLYM
jgi:cyanate lyase